MSLSIDVHKVSAVLLADGWHEVADHSLVFDSYEFLQWPDEQQQGGQARLVHRVGTGGVSENGFQFAEQMVVPGSVAPGERPGERLVRMSGPLAAVLAVRIDEEV
jgi:hypothetical protein